MNLPIPLEALENHVGMLGKTGTGKSYAAQGLVERLMRGASRVCLIDPMDRYWGLRLESDGKTPSKHPPVIFGGNYADMPLSGAHGPALAEIAGTSTTPMIISTRLLKVSERVRFFTDFAETLLAKNQGPLHLVIDEAHLFAPQGGAKVGGGAPDMLHAANNLVSLGRGAGLRIILISQRPAKLHKDSLTQVETLVAFRLIAPQDRDAVHDWIKEWADEETGQEVLSSLPSLATGEAWVWAPTMGILRRAAFPRIQTFDSGQPVKRKVTLGPIELDKVRGRLEVIAKEVIENDPKALKAEITKLRAELRKRPENAPPPPKQDTQASYNRGYLKGYNAGIRDGAQGVELLAREASKQMLTAIAAGKTGFLEAAKKDTPEVPALERAAAPAPTRRAVDSEPRRDGADVVQRILDGLAELSAIGVNLAPRAQAALLAGYGNPKSGGFVAGLAAALSEGLIEYPTPGLVALTNAGHRRARAAESPLTDIELHERIMSLLRDNEQRVLRALIEAGQPMSREEVAKASNYGNVKSGGFVAALSRLRALELVEYPTPGSVAPAERLWIG